MMASMAALVEHKKARMTYAVLETYEAGIELLGHEVKAIRNGMANLEGARVVVRGDEAFLTGATVSPYQPGNTPKSYDKSRARKLLLSKKEIAELAGYEHQKGLTIIPLSWYNKGRVVKTEVAVVKHKKQHDKRESLKARDAKRHIERTLKGEYGS
jgi:SsrA-binding protein